MSLSQMLSHAGTISVVLAALVVIAAAFRTNTTRIWREEAEAQKSRADRLEASLNEINTRLSRIEVENERLVHLLTSLDPARLAFIRLATTPTEE
ncbi:MULTISPECIES: hypothetical protein [unclassified Streptomyces]|uniref:hypothetical protein n=1 Tax=Streptomyces sp. NPDC055082 TaxID=3365718 RepID=UPI0037D65A28